MKTIFTIPTDTTVLAYAAGFFDGEGCVLIAKPYNKKNNRRYHRLDVSIGQKDPRPLVWMLEHFGGRIQPYLKKKSGYIGHWILHDQKAGDFLTAIRPYLVLKGEQTDIALAFRATVAKRQGNVRVLGGWGKTAFRNPDAIDQSLEAKRDAMRDELSRLKVVK